MAGSRWVKTQKKKNESLEGGGSQDRGGQPFCDYYYRRRGEKGEKREKVLRGKTFGTLGVGEGGPFRGLGRSGKLGKKKNSIWEGERTHHGCK